MLLDQVSPRWHHRERHAVRAGAFPAASLAAVTSLEWGQVPVFRALMTARSLGRPLPARRAILDGMTGLGFAELARAENEVVFGVIGRPWSLRGGLVRVSGPTEFTRWSAPGWAVMSMNFIAAEGFLGTETRVWLTSRSARLRFAPYWSTVHPFSAWIRRSWLRAAVAATEQSIQADHADDPDRDIDQPG